ncbi:MAG: hypothetical protein N2Z65_00335, partial [Clostridiales bacterium]|nr:hypothetical protein [Clostridiales bacterium]
VLSFAAFGIQNLLALPVLLLLSAQSYLWAKARFQTSAGGRRLLSSKMPNICLPVISIFFVVLFVCTLIEMYLSPLLISYVQHFL